MFYFTCNELKYMKVSLFEISYKKKNELFHIFWDVAVLGFDGGQTIRLGCSSN